MSKKSKTLLAATTTTIQRKQPITQIESLNNTRVYLYRHHIDIVALLIQQSPLERRLQNVVSLRVTVGNRSNGAVWIVLREVQGERAPSAAQIDNAHAIDDARALTIQGEHGQFAVRKRCCFCVPQSRRILFARPEAQVVKGGGHFVMLIVGRGRFNCNGHDGQIGHNLHFGRVLRFDSTRVADAAAAAASSTAAASVIAAGSSRLVRAEPQLPQMRTQLTANAPSNDPIRHEAVLNEGQDGLDGRGHDRVRPASPNSGATDGRAKVRPGDPDHQHMVRSNVRVASPRNGRNSSRNQTANTGPRLLLSSCCRRRTKAHRNDDDERIGLMNR